MSWITKKLLKYVDSKGNKYYLAENNKRIVEYKNLPDPSSIDPKYHAWLHCLVEDVDESSNRTSCFVSSINKNKSIYTPWQPKQPQKL